MTKKVQNYTDEQVTSILAGYDIEADYNERNEQVKKLAVDIGKKPASVIAKLSSLGVYKAKTYVNKQGEKSIRKSAIVGMIANVMGESEEAFDSLSKANKTVLESVWNFVKPEEIVESAEPETENPNEVEPEAV